MSKIVGEAGVGLSADGDSVRKRPVAEGAGGGAACGVAHGENSAAAAGRGDKTRRDERDAGHDREGGERGALGTKLAPLDRRRGKRRAGDSGRTDGDHDRV